MTPTQINELKKLAELYKAGVLNEDEFKAAKQKVFAQIGDVGSTTPSLDIVDTTLLDNIEQGQPDEQEQPDELVNSDVSHEDIATYENPFDEPESEEYATNSKKKWFIFGGIGLLICIAAFFIFHKSDYEKAMDKIENQQGKILTNIQDGDNHVLIYSTANGLFYWDLRSKEPKKLYTNIDSLKVQRYYLGDNYCLEKKSEEYPKEISVISVTDDRVFNTVPNVIQSVSPLELYKVAWPWILIGKHYIAHVSDPNVLINIRGYSTGEIFNDLPSKDDTSFNSLYNDSVNIDNDRNLVLNIRSDYLSLPGISDYRPKYIDKDTWTEHLYIDPYLMLSYCNLFQSEYEMNETLGIPLSDDLNVYRKIIITPSNEISQKQELSWNGSNFDNSNLSAVGMQKIYESTEKKYQDIITKELPKKRAEIEKYASDYRENMIAKIKENAISFSDITNDYKRNLRKAVEEFPLGQNYVLKVHIENIRYVDGDYSYRLSINDVFVKAYFYSNDSNFTNLSYPCTVYLYANFDDYRIDHDYMGSGVVDCYFYFINAQLLYANQ